MSQKKVKAGRSVVRTVGEIPFALFLCRTNSITNGNRTEMRIGTMTIE